MIMWFKKSIPMLKDIIIYLYILGLADEAKAKMGGGSHDPEDPNNKHKISEWQAAWNVTNAIQVNILKFTYISNI